MAHLYRVIVPVSDIEAAQAFYADVLGQPGHRISPGRHYFDCEGTGEQSLYVSDPFDNQLCFVSRKSVFTG